jgi:hypothetical protein
MELRWVNAMEELLLQLKLRSREMSGKHHPARLRSGSESPACSRHSAL